MKLYVIVCADGQMRAQHSEFFAGPWLRTVVHGADSSAREVVRLLALHACGPHTVVAYVPESEAEARVED